MLEDKRLEKKLLLLKDQYENVETVSDSEKILYNIINDADIKKPKMKFPFMYVASIAAVIIIGVFAGLSSYLGGGEKSEHEALSLDESPESFEAPNHDNGLITSDAPEEKQSEDSKSIVYYEKQLLSYVLILRSKAQEALGTSDVNILDSLYSLSSMERLIRDHFSEAVTSNDSAEFVEKKYDETTVILNTLIEQVKFFYGDEIFENQEEAIIENYNRYKENYDDEVLRGLDPYEVMAIYLYANAIGDEEIQWELLMKSNNHHYPPKEEWAEYPSTEENRQYWRKLIEGIDRIEQNFSDYENGAFTDAVIFLYMSENYDTKYDEDEDESLVHGFQLSKNDQGIWKVDFMPMQ
jgi:hypothetical protein